MSKSYIHIRILLFFASLYYIFSIGHFGGDGYQDYLTAESIVMDRNLYFEDNISGSIEQLGYIKGLGVIGRDGRTYSSRGVSGTAIMLVPFYFVGHIFSNFVPSVPHAYVTMLVVSFANPTFLAICCLLIFCISGQLGFGRRISLLLTFIFGLSTMVPIYARTGFGEISAMMFMLTSIYFILKFKSSMRMIFLIISAVSLAFMFYSRAVTIIFFPCFLFYLIWVVKSSGDKLMVKFGYVILYMSLLGAFFLFQIVLNRIVYGKFLGFGGFDAVEVSQRIARSPHFLKGIYYYIFSTGKGFFIFNIPAILALSGIKTALLKRKKETIFFILIFLVNLFFYVKSFRRGSLFSWGPRYLIFSVPFFIFLIGFYLQQYKGIISRMLVLITSLTGFLSIFPCFFINQSKFYMFVVEKLGLDEYMINFIPDLSPIKGAWYMFISRIYEKLGLGQIPFIYSPDYKLLEPIRAFMSEYNYFDIWFLKIIRLAPEYSNLILLLVLPGMLTILIISLVGLFSRHEDRHTCS